MSDQDKERRHIENLPQAFARHRVVTDKDGNPIDYIFLEVNTAFEEMTGLSRDEILGQKVTTALPGIENNNFDWIGVYGKVALEGKTISFEQYSKPLDRWYDVTAYSDEPGHFITVFNEITAKKEELVPMKSLLQMSEKLVNTSAAELDYQELADTFKKLSGAKYVAINTYEEEYTKTVTRAIAGAPSAITRAADMLGFDPTGHAWEIIPERLHSIEGGKLVHFPGIYEASMGALNKSTASLLEKTFNIGDIYVISLAFGESPSLGDVIFFMPRNQTIQNREAVELYAGQVGSLLARICIEEALQESEKRYRQIADNAADVIWTTDMNFNLTYVSPSIEKLGGETVDEHLIKILDQKFTPHSLQQIITVFQEEIEKENDPSADKNRTRIIEVEQYKSDGKTIWVAMHISGLRDNAGNIIGFQGVSRDITESKKAEEKLHASEQKYRLIFENSPLGVLHFDREGTITACNDKFVEIIGSSQKDLVGLNMLKLQDKQVAAAVQEALNGGYGFYEGWYHSVTAPKVTPLRALFTPFVTGEGYVSGGVGIVEDITERKQAEESLRYQLELEKLVSEISSYLGSLSAEQLNEGISTALKMAGEYFQVDRSYVFQFSEDMQTRSMTHEWCAEGIKPQKERLQDQPLSDLPWWTEKLKLKSCIHIPEADSLPPEAKGEKREFKAQNLNSLICVPLTEGEQLIGSLGFDSVKQKREWTKAHETLLFILAELISSALARCQAEGVLKKSEQKYREILSTIEEGYYEVDLAGNFVFFNDSLCTVLGYSRDELKQRSYKKLYKNPQEVFQIYNRLYRTGIAEKATDWPVTTKDGQEIFVEVSITLRRDEAGNPIGFRGIARDVTERRLAEEKLHEYEKLQQLLINLATECINVPLEKIDAGINEMLEAVGEFTKVDRVYIFNHDYDRRVTSNTHEWCAEGITPEIDNLQATPFNHFPDILEAHQKGEIVHIPDVSRMPENHAMRFHFEAQGIQSLILLPLFSENVYSGFVGFDAVKKKKAFTEQEINLLKILAEITSNVLARQKTETNIRYMSFHDQLTGLYNRYFLGEEMERLDTARQLPLAVIMADLNGLKLVNDTYGHDTGDKMLKTAADIIKNSCREEDIIGRFGGDEFVILLPQTTEETARLICKRIEEGCRGALVEDVPVSIALGIATKTSETTNPIETLREAENEMYRQKLTESRSTKSAVVTSLLNTLAEKSFETEEHTRGMQEVAQKIGAKLNLPGSELHRLELLITLHDIGKINISEAILTKKGSPTDDEWAVIKKHPEIGYRIAMATEQFAHVADNILAHHERWDGTGYPQGLKGNDIPLLARIVAIADAYEVMSNGRPYKKAMSRNEIIAEFRRCSGKQFDPELIEILLSVMEADG